MDEGPRELLKAYSPSDFKTPTEEDIIAATIKFGGRFGGNAARIKVFKSNTKLFQNWDSARLGNKEDLLSGTKVYDSSFQLPPSLQTYNTLYDCVNEDCSSVAEELIKDNLNPAILNLASSFVPCGGYPKGSNAQEESLCYMSTLSQSLYQFGNMKYKHIRESGLPNIPNIYPMDINYGGIYSPNVTFIRYNLDRYYSFRENPFSCSIISVASLSNRETDSFINTDCKYFNVDGTLTLEGENIERNKIRTIFRIALSNHHDSIVLGAFGCGAYQLLPHQISKLFKETLNEEEFYCRFKKVVFAIYEGKGSTRKIVGEDGKYKPFYQDFKHRGL